MTKAKKQTEAGVGQESKEKNPTKKYQSEKTTALLSVANKIEKITQSQKKAALLSAVAELRQIANNFESWAKEQQDRFCGRPITPAFCEKWMSDWLSDSYVLTLFDYPVPKQPNGLFPNGSKKVFSILVDTFRINMPHIALSLTDTYNLFSRWVRETVWNFENEKTRQDPIFSYWIDNFLKQSPSFVMQRFRHISEIILAEFKIKAEPITLIEFMEQYCEPQEASVLFVRRTSLQKANKRGSIELPQHIGNHKTGQSKIYNSLELLIRWPKYRDKLPNLPALKQLS